MLLAGPGPAVGVHPAAPEMRIISKTTLLRSAIWDLNTQFYCGAGGSVDDGSALEAVPDWPSNHPKLAKALVRVCVKFLQEATRLSGSGRPGEPMYIIEIGSGSAKLAYAPCPLARASSDPASVDGDERQGERARGRAVHARTHARTHARAW
jgi:hypothetical protein